MNTFYRMVHVVLTLSGVGCLMSCSDHGKATTRARIEMSDLSGALQTLRLFDEARFIEGVESDQSAKKLYRAIYERSWPMEILMEKPSWSRSKSLVDPWGTAYIFIWDRTEPADRLAPSNQVVKIISYGPDCQDDGGGRDDLVEVVRPKQ